MGRDLQKMADGRRKGLLQSPENKQGRWKPVSEEAGDAEISPALTT